MDKTHISFFEKPPAQALAQMEKGLLDYAVKHGVNVDFKPFSFVLYNEKEDVIGMMEAFSSYSCIHIQDLWIDASYRGKGLGRQLLKTLEQHFEGKGFNNINLVSCAFQAPEFYEKCGYQIEFIRKNKLNPKLDITFLIKYF